MGVSALDQVRAAVAGRKTSRPWMTAREITETFGLSTTQVRWAAQRGRVRTRKAGGRREFRVDDVKVLMMVAGRERDLRLAPKRARVVWEA